ncbi:MAG TPA: hypothetical protein ENK51_08405 [Gammaproteobacteria bacterium]|nr:hypothetical protein [Gammaproteobacteria bacterium]
MRDSRQSANTAQTALGAALTVFLALGLATEAGAGTRDQAKRIHDRLVGTPPSIACLDQLQARLESEGAKAAALDAIDNTGSGDACTDPSFYNVTLKNFITPWTNEEQTVFAPLNDYTATVIGIIRDERDFRQILWEDVLYIGNGVSPAYANDSNAHYETIEDQGLNLADPAVLVATTQSAVTGLPAEATAGIITTRGAARSFFIDGTNRAMFRFTLLNHLCTDLEQIKDPTRTHDRIPQDVARSPGGDSRIFMNACVGCHAGMDPLRQSMAYYDFEYSGDADSGRLVYNTAAVETDNEGNPTRVQRKYLINANNFEFGYVVPDDQWENYWRAGPNSALGWDPSLPGKGAGAKSFGMEFAYSEAFARCQVEKVFKAVCFRPPVDASDRSQIDGMITTFKSSSYNLKQVFAESADYCKGD